MKDAHFVLNLVVGVTPVLKDEVDYDVLVKRPLRREDLSGLERSLAITFILLGINLAWMDMLRVITSKNKDCLVGRLPSPS